LIHVGKETREEKVQLEISEDSSNNQQSYGIAFFDQPCCLSSKNSLSNIIFPALNFSLLKKYKRLKPELYGVGEN